VPSRRRTGLTVPRGRKANDGAKGAFDAGQGHVKGGRPFHLSYTPWSITHLAQSKERITEPKRRENDPPVLNRRERRSEPEQSR
jgi:hypothetical protein